MSGRLNSEKEVMEIQGLCQKDNRQVIISRGCLHPEDYCPYRDACLINYLEVEKRISLKKRHLESCKEKEE
ncbi:MAG: hypothetical protein BA861_08685 [Desulfobacterales bacterium S3730MH5]|nr:MAG: hypothetical protein BA861_08685 [Desulfobacterales bacterium S3730MH5]